jgi:hypothetical protein
MKIIYQTAKCVYANIDVVEPHSSTEIPFNAFKGLDLLSTSIARMVRSNEIKEWSDFYNLQWMMRVPEFRDTQRGNERERSKSPWFAINALGGHPFFSRIWIWQELCFAKGLIFMLDDM